MPIQNLKKIFHPQSVAVIGASRRENRVGHTVLQNLIGGGLQGDIYPVNPKYKAIGGMPCFSKVSELPTTADLAVVCTPA
ncbi:CoA-binding protein [Lignipirellula cremea]|uniref:CoA binding domain protein n=1 Tax=Lignipirellula cremea TaxID=2528010 RepID=A0A518E469_9BACT|nr:CoA-binding protein [Lignipirellula cremea]QDU98885.1 CoA binding domain protein [Lignipirellula cremea]